MEYDDRIKQVAASLNHWDKRRRLVDSILWGSKGLLGGLLAAVLLAVMARLTPLMNQLELATAALLLGAAGLTAGIIYSWAIPRTILSKARFSDRQFNLLERTSTAIEIGDGTLSADENMAGNQLIDTLSAANKVNAVKFLPFRFQRRDGFLILAALILISASVILDNPEEATLERRRAMNKVVEEQIASLESLKEDFFNSSELSAAALEALSAPVESALEELGEKDIGREELMATLSEAEAEFRDLSQRNDAGELIEKLSEASKPLSQVENGQALGEALKNGNLSGAAVEMNNLADSLPLLSSEILENLAQSLAQAAEALTSVDPELAERLLEAAASIETGDIENAQQSLREAAGTLQQRNQEQATAALASAAAEQLQEGGQAAADAGEGQLPGEGGGDSGVSSSDGSGDSQSGEGSAGGGDSGSSGAGGAASSSGDSGGSGSSALEQGGGTGGPGPGGGHSENVYVPEYVDLSSEGGSEVELPAECTANPAQCGILISESPTAIGAEESLVPYERVFGDYRRAAYIALEEEYVPLGLREYVKEYFTSLEP